MGWEPEWNDTAPNPPRIPPHQCPGYVVTSGISMISAAWCDQVSLTPFLYTKSSRLGYSLSSPFPCPFQMQGPGWLQESTYSGSDPSQGVFFGALQGFFSLLIPNQQDQRAMSVPCTRDVLPRNSMATTDPYSQASWGRSPQAPLLG